MREVSWGEGMKVVGFLGGVLHIKGGGKWAKTATYNPDFYTKCGRFIHDRAETWKPKNNNIERSARRRRLWICQQCYKPLPLGFLMEVTSIVNGTITVKDGDYMPGDITMAANVPITKKAKGFYILAEILQGYDTVVDMSMGL